MTEAEWLTCADPSPMLEFLRWQTSNRKFRLFAVACCRRIWPWIEKSLQDAVSTAESFADGHATADELCLASSVATEYSLDGWMIGGPAGATMWTTDPAFGASAAGHAAAAVVDAKRSEATRYGHCLGPRSESVVVTDEQLAQAALLRDIVGNPLHPITISSGRRTPTVVDLAEGIYTDRVFHRLPELADALRRTGYTNNDVFDHCQALGPHVRGCWVVDLILGKE